MLPFYPTDRRLPPAQLTPNMSQPFTQMPNFMPSATNPPLYGQPASHYMRPQNVYTASNLYPAAQIPNPVRSYPIKRERKTLQIVDPVTKEVVDVSSSRRNTSLTSSVEAKPGFTAAGVPSTNTVSANSHTLHPTAVPVQKRESKALKIEAPEESLAASKPPKVLKIEKPSSEEQQSSQKSSESSKKVNDIGFLSPPADVPVSDKVSVKADTSFDRQKDAVLPDTKPSSSKDLEAILTHSRPDLSSSIQPSAVAPKSAQVTTVSPDAVSVKDTPPKAAPVNAVPSTLASLNAKLPARGGKVEELASTDTTEKEAAVISRNKPEIVPPSFREAESKSTSRKSEPVEPEKRAVQESTLRAESEEVRAETDIVSTEHEQAHSRLSTETPKPAEAAKVLVKEAGAQQKKEIATTEVQLRTPDAKDVASNDLNTMAKEAPESAEKKSEELSWRKTPALAGEGSKEKSWRGKSPSVVAPIGDSPKAQTSGLSDEAKRTPKRQRPKPVVHPDGARRFYELAWLVEMKDFCTTAKVPTEVLKCNISRTRISQGSSSSTRGPGHGGGQSVSQSGPGGSSSWTRGQTPHVGGVFSSVSGKGGSGSYSHDRVPRRGVKPPPSPSSQGENWRERSRTNEIPGRSRTQPAASLPPVEPLKRSANAWARRKEDDDEVAAKAKATRSVLNKLTPEKFGRLYKQLLEVKVTSSEVLAAIVNEIFEKAILEAKFADMYAHLCQLLDKDLSKMLAVANEENSQGRKITFKRMLIRNVQDEFGRFTDSEKLSKASTTKSTSSVNGDASTGNEPPKESTTSKEAGKTSETAAGTGERTSGGDGGSDTKETELEEERAWLATKAKRRMLGNINFIGELYKKSLIAEKIIHKECIQRLLNLGIETKEEELLEALCKLLASVGEKLSANPKAKDYMNRYFEELDKLSRLRSLPSRMRFMIQNLIEMRQKGWKRRREEAKAKTISEVHADIKREEREKQEASARSRSRSGSGRSYYRNDRGMARSQAPTMTMAPVRQNTATVSRAVRAREKYISTGFIPGDVRLAGMDRNPLGRPGQGPSTSLKPGGANRASSSNTFSALSTPEDIGSHVPVTGRPILPSTVRGTRLGPNAGRFESPVPSRQLPKAKPEPPSLDPEKVRKKAKSIVEEYLSIKDIKEAKECVKDEVPDANYSAFVETAIRLSLEFKPQDCEHLIPFFCGVADVIPGSHFVSAFTAVLSSLDDIEMDTPKASQFVSKYIARLAAAQKLPKSEEDQYGLNFVSSVLDEIHDKKRAMKVVVFTFSEFYSCLQQIISDVRECQAVVVKTFSGLSVDLKKLAEDWNPGRGVSVLSELLSTNKVAFLEPLLGLEEKVKPMLAGGKSGKEVAAFLRKSLPETALKSPQLGSMLTRIGLEYACSSTKEATKEALSAQKIENESVRFTTTVAPMLVGVFGKAETEGFAEVRFSIVLEVQRFCAEYNFPPGMLDKDGHEQKLISRLFYYLYELEVVEEEVLKKWRDDLEESAKVGGKGIALVQSQRLFTWLETAETED